MTNEEWDARGDWMCTKCGEWMTEHPHKKCSEPRPEIYLPVSESENV